MDFKTIRNKAIKLYQNGATIQEINKKVGITLNLDTIQKWIIDDEYNSYKYVIFKLQKKQKAEEDVDKRKQILLEMKQKLEDVLKVVPNDIDMQTKLMYTCINLKDIEAAREIGYKLLEQTDSKEVLNGVSIIEEKNGNYDKAIEMIEKILSIDPNNEFYKSKKQRLQNKKENKSNNEKDRLYARMATLERSVNRLIEQKQGEITLQGQKANVNEITKDVYKEVYSKIKVIAESILEKFPEDNIAKEKLVKSLYLIGEKEEAKNKGEEFLKSNNEEEKFTEEARQVWLESIKKEFQYGKISLKDVEDKIKEARNYPNYIKSFIELLKLKTMITEDLQGEIEELDKYLETEYSISKEDYKLILDEMSRIKNQIDEKKIIDNYYDTQENNSEEER